MDSKRVRATNKGKVGNMHAGRMLKLIRHMESGEWFNGEFNMALFFGGITRPCGCMLGELPRLFPNEWKIEKFEPMLIVDSTTLTFNDAARFFEIDARNALVLFTSKFDVGLYNKQYYLDRLKTFYLNNGGEL